MNKLARKLAEIEKYTINSTPNPEETFLWVNNQAEQTLYQLAREITTYRQKQLEELEAMQKIYPTTDHKTKEANIITLNNEHETIMQQIEHLSFQRAFHIFEKAIAIHYHQNDPECKTHFMTRFFWFLTEIQDMTKHILWEKQITNQPNFHNLSESEQEEKLKPCMNSWREWFTPESYHNYLKTLPHQT